jgi:hypothetical protein
MRQQLEPDQQRGAAAKQLLDNKYLKEAFEAAEKSILDQMDEVSLRDTDMHTRLIVARKTVHSIRRYIERFVETGNIATLQLEKPGLVKGFLRR